MDGDDGNSAVQSAVQPGMHRVKLYKLNPQGLWDDKGTGHVAVEWLPKAESLGLVVVSEADCRILMVHKISKQDIYQRQGEDTIITWADVDLGSDVALSFQESSGCNVIWSTIERVRLGGGQMMIMSPHGSMPDDGHPMQPSLPGIPGLSDGGGAQGMPAVELPWPEASNLGDIAKTLSELNYYQKERMATQIHRESRYLPRLLEVFRACEAADDREALKHMYIIIKSIFMMNGVQLMDEMMQEEHFWDVIGALEYDPELSPKKADHRHFLREVATFKEVVPIPSEPLKRKIHVTYRLGYIKDAVLPRVLDDVTFAALHSMMMFNYIEILTALQHDQTFFRDLFARLKKGDTSSQYWAMLVAFIQELSQLATHPQYSTRQELYLKLVDEGLLEVLTTCMECGAAPLKLKATDILLSMVQHDPSPIRAHLLRPPHRLFSCLVADLTGGDSNGVPEQILELLKMLLDPETMEQSLEKNEFLELFYDSYIGRLIDVLTASAPARPVRAELSAASVEPAPAAAAPATEAAAPPTSAAEDAAGPAPALPPLEAPQAATPVASVPGEGLEGAGQGAATDEARASGAAPPFVLGLIMDLLCFCVTHHTFRIKYFILRHNIMQKVLLLLNCRQRWLVVAAIRFLRTCVGLKDDFYNRYLTRNDLFEPALQAFLDNGDRYNLLNSAFLELMDFIRRENIRSLVCHIVDRYWPLVQHINYVHTFRELWQLRERYNCPPDQNMTVPNGAPSALPQPLLRRDSRDLDREEEAYFASADDDEDAGKAGTSSGSAGALGGEGRSPPVSDAAPGAALGPQDGPHAATPGQHPSGRAGGVAAAPAGGATVPAAVHTVGGALEASGGVFEAAGASGRGTERAGPRPDCGQASVSLPGLGAYDDDEEGGDDEDAKAGGGTEGDGPLGADAVGTKRPLPACEDAQVAKTHKPELGSSPHSSVA